MDRRQFVKYTGAFASTSAVATLGVAPAFAQSELKVAVMLPQSGPAGLFGPSSKACAELAAETLNAKGGVLGRKISLLFGDAIDYRRVRVYNRRYMPFQPRNCAMTPNGSMYFHRSCFLHDYSRGDPTAAIKARAVADQMRPAQ